ncbi:MAG TPA: DUF4388 domain-containing protein [Acidimicrobiia bacterium]|nr:DUF4388 domain-containing protein [Acidimicrobiia bacterium]
MALSGNLGFVPLDEVLRLLMRSDQRGSVEVRGEDVRGRVYVGKKGISLATIAEDRDLHKHLVNSGYVDDAFLRKVAVGEASFSDVPDREAAIVDLLREITIESLYHLSDKGATFEVAEGAVTPYGSPRPFELEAILDDVRRRTMEWESVHEVIADLDATIKMNRDAGDQEEIKLNREAWRLLCELGSGASVSVIAERLGTTEFWIAKVAAELAERELLLLSDDFADDGVARTEPTPSASSFSTEQIAPDQSWWVEPENEAPEARPDSSQTLPAPAAEGSATRSDEQPSEEETRESRFGHFVRSARAESAFAADDETPAPAVEPEPAQTGLQAPFQETSALQTEAEPESVEEDTEAFLEKVFSQLDGNGQAEVEEEGHGLLRRRRMGSVLKEIDED